MVPSVRKVGRNPMTVESSPPTVAPIGAAPVATSCEAALTRSDDSAQPHRGEQESEVPFG